MSIVPLLNIYIRFTYMGCTAPVPNSLNNPPIPNPDYTLFHLILHPILLYSILQYHFFPLVKSIYSSCSSCQVKFQKTRKSKRKRHPSNLKHPLNSFCIPFTSSPLIHPWQRHTRRHTTIPHLGQLTTTN